MYVPYLLIIYSKQKANSFALRIAAMDCYTKFGIDISTAIVKIIETYNWIEISLVFVPFIFMNAIPIYRLQTLYNSLLFAY